MGEEAAPNPFSTDPAKVSFSTEVPCLMNIMWQAQCPSRKAQVRPSLLLCPLTHSLTHFIDTGSHNHSCTYWPIDSLFLLAQLLFYLLAHLLSRPLPQCLIHSLALFLTHSLT